LNEEIKRKRRAKETEMEEAVMEYRPSFSFDQDIQDGVEDEDSDLEDDEEWEQAARMHAEEVGPTPGLPRRPQAAGAPECGAPDQPLLHD